MHAPYYYKVGGPAVADMCICVKFYRRGQDDPYSGELAYAKKILQPSMLVYGDISGVW